jgi:hypothetical protein
VFTSGQQCFICDCFCCIPAVNIECAIAVAAREAELSRMSMKGIKEAAFASLLA